MNWPRQSVLSRALLSFFFSALVWLPPAVAVAQKKPKEPPKRSARFDWDEKRSKLSATTSFRDAVDRKIRQKLSRGLPTTIVFTGTLYRTGSKTPLAATAQSCRVTWLVWEEYYRVEINRPGKIGVEKTLTVEGVLRRCAEARRLHTATGAQVPAGATLYMTGSVLVNPISPELLKKIKRWVSRPTSTATAGPSDALFSTFTSLFLRMIGPAERQLIFTTKNARAIVPKPKEKKK